MRNKKILITGAGGFIASHLTRKLVNLGANVSIITKYKSIIDNVRINKIWDEVSVIEADIRNLDSLKQIKQLKPEIVYHLAAYNHVGHSFMHVSECFDVNAKGTAKIKNSAKVVNLIVFFILQLKAYPNLPLHFLSGINS